MSSPKEPGPAHAGDGAAPAEGPGNGSAAPGHDAGARPAHVADTTELPPWQRGPATRARQQPQAPGSPRPDGPRGGNQGGLDARLNRFMAGGSAPSGAPDAPPRNEPPRNDAPRNEPPRNEPAPRNDRTDVVRPEPKPRHEGGRPEGAAYASELPDLSGPRPPQPPRKPIERPSTESKPPAKGSPSPAGRVQVASRQHRGPVRASMQIRRVDPWSTLKVSLLLSVVLFFVWMIAVAFLYLVLGGMGVWSKLNSNVGDLLTSASGSSGGELVSSGTIFGGAALIGLVNIVLLTAGATIGAFIYNLTTDLVGGVEVTLADRD
ncbi:DUF3566 domain-containing protein [Mycolicibacterium gilvum]|uniref:Putative integral membrane protein n=1 Tax=Mycolicibacterium gilvum TaxID=1804 RepID=A0A378SD96_9MYCO|nr:DUF3566 domain-containing protein [Mycolicibacterium gilvum]MCV7054740.1 DUF3566 domain-containing protein [Mycolicibacterium gilvum]STZ40812.1 putative integral membrane protein [Mycolicibacterium gilvum]